MFTVRDLVETEPLTLSAPASFMKIYFLPTISLQSKLFGFENKGNDHTQQAVQYEK